MVINQGEVKEVSLLTFPLPYDVPKITFPIPFTIYPCRAFTNNPSPFLHNYYKFYNDHNSSLLPLSQPPCDEPSTPSSTSPPPLFKPGVKTALDLACMKKQEKNLRKLEEPQDIFHKASRINGDYGTWNKIDPSFDPPKDKICIVTQNNNVHELEFVPQQPGWHPFSTYDYSKQTSFLNMTHTTPLPSLSSLPDMSEDELADNEEDDQDDSSYGSDYNNYPTSHPKFITTAPSVVRTIKPTITMKIPASIPENHTHIPSNGLTWSPSLKGNSMDEKDTWGVTSILLSCSLSWNTLTNSPPSPSQENSQLPTLPQHIYSPLPLTRSWRRTSTIFATLTASLIANSSLFSAKYILCQAIFLWAACLTLERQLPGTHSPTLWAVPTTLRAQTSCAHRAKPSARHWVLERYSYCLHCTRQHDYSSRSPLGEIFPAGRPKL